MGSNELFEFIGTAVMLLLGGGVCANVSLSKTKGKDSGWIVISIAWGLAVFVGAYIAAPSGAHLNPAVTIGLAISGAFKGNVLTYIIAQMLGGMLGAFLTYIAYKKHFDAEDNPDTKLGVFCTAPAIRSYGYNFITEIIGTFLLVFGILYAAGAQIVGPLPVSLLVMVIGMSLGGPTGYAINPARDLPPRIVHALLPIKGKRDSDWAYSWIPVIAPIVGSVLAALAYIGVESFVDKAI